MIQLKSDKVIKNYFTLQYNIIQVDLFVNNTIINITN